MKQDINYTLIIQCIILRMAESSTSINKIINGWNTIEKLDRSVLLLGYGHTGRSTFSELVKKYKYKNKSNDLNYESNKYVLEGIIATKAIKLQTITPVLYEKQPTNKAELKILDVPTYVFSPQNKKWTSLEQKLSLKYMIQKNEKVVFLLFVDEKNTRSNVVTWKKTVQSFLQWFQLNKLQPNYELFNSVAMIFTKSEAKQDTMVKRIKLLQQALQKDKIFDQTLIEKFCKSITDNNNILIFEKISNDQRQKDEIIKNYEILEKMQGYNINSENFKQLTFSAQEQKSFNSYFETADEVIKNLAICVSEIIQLEQFSYQNIQQIKKKYFSNINTNIKDIKISDQLRKKFEHKKQKIQSYTFIKSYSEACKDTVKIASEEDFLKIIDDIIKFSIFIDNQDPIIFQIIIEAFQFKKISGINMIQYETYCEAYQNIFNSQLQSKAFRRLVEAEEAVTDLNMKKQFYQYAVKTLELRQVPQNLSQFFQKCKLQLNKYQNPKMAISFLLKSLKQNLPKDKAYEHASSIAYTLKAKQLYIEAARIYKISNNPHEAIQCFKHIFTQSQQSSLQYIEYLLELNLFYDAKKASMQACAKFGYKSRRKYGEHLKKIEESERRFFQGRSETNCLLQQISNQGVQQIKKISQKALQKLQ